MSNKLHQINIQYSNKEDRILLRFSTESHDEYGIWLTRRFTKILLDVLDKEMEQRGGTTTLGSQDQTKQLFKEGVFEQPYAKEKTQHRPLGEQGMLAFGIRTQTDKTGNLSLEIQSETDKGININLNDTLIYMFYSMLMQAIAVSEWQIEPFPSASMPLH